MFVFQKLQIRAKIYKNSNIQEKSLKILKIAYWAFWTRLSSGNQVDGLPLALNKDAVSASWRFFDRACERTFDKVFSVINEYFDEKSLVNHQNSDSSDIKDSLRAIECEK